MDDSWRCSKQIPTATDDDGTLVNWIEVEASKTEEEIKAEWAMDSKPAVKTEGESGIQMISHLESLSHFCPRPHDRVGTALSDLWLSMPLRSQLCIESRETYLRAPKSPIADQKSTTRPNGQTSSPPPSSRTNTLKNSRPS